MCFSVLLLMLTGEWSSHTKTLNVHSEYEYNKYLFNVFCKSLSLYILKSRGNLYLFFYFILEMKIVWLLLVSEKIQVLAFSLKCYCVIMSRLKKLWKASRERVIFDSESNKRVTISNKSLIDQLLAILSHSLQVAAAVVKVSHSRDLWKKRFCFQIKTKAETRFWYILVRQTKVVEEEHLILAVKWVLRDCKEVSPWEKSKLMIICFQQSELVVLLLLDLMSPLDTADHEILIDRLELSGH